MRSNYDLKMISGDFLYEDIPVDKEWLRKYFPGEVQKRFLVYWVHFKDLTKVRHIMYFSRCFKDHTGICCEDRWFYELVHRIVEIERVAEEAEKNQDLEMLANVKLGFYKLKRS